MRIWGFTRVVGAAVLSLCGTVPILGQGSLPVTVVVTDPSGAKIAKAEVQLVAKNADGASRAVTDKEGRATVALEPGEYRLRVASPGFVAANESLDLIGAVTIPVMLRVAAGCPPCTRIVHRGYGDSLKTDVRAPQALLQSEEVPDSPGAKADVLVIEAGPGERGVFTAASLREYPQTKVTVFDHHTNRNETYAGVPLIDLLAHLGVSHGKEMKGKVLSEYVVAAGADGYKSVVALGEVDPEFHPGVVLVADELDGKPMDAATGPFRLVVSEDKRPARSVRNLVKIEVRKAE